MSATKNINAEKIQGSLTATTLNITTLGTGTSVNNLGIDSNGNVVTGTTGGGGDNFYVTGFTYDDVNTFTISRNGGLVDLTSTISILSGITYYGDGSNLDGISSTDNYVTGGTYSNDVLTLNRTNGSVNIDLPETYVTGATLNGNNLEITRNQGLPTLSVDLSQFIDDTDTFVSGGTYSNGNLYFSGNSSETTFTVDVSGLLDDTNNYVTGFTYNDNNTFTISRNGGLSDLTSTINNVSGFTVNGNLNVNGETVLSSSTQNTLTIIGSGSTNPLFLVQGSAGELFSITDSLTGTLFAVNNISGLPILEVNSDDEILMGSYQAPSLNTTFKTSITAGLTELYTIPVSAYTGGFFEYTLTGAGARAGSIMSIFSGSSVNYTETTTTDIGDTSPVTFDMNVSGGTANLTVSATTGTWEIKTIVRSI